MKLKLISFVLALAVTGWTQNPTPTPNPAPSAPAKAACACCSDQAKGSDHPCCHANKTADGTEAACCSGKEGTPCCDAKAQCMTSKDKTAACCGAGSSCCKEGAACCKAKEGDKVAMACCSGNHCDRHKHNASQESLAR